MLKGKTAVITGSTSGIGLGIAKSFAAQGVNIMLNGFGETSVIKDISKAIGDEFNVDISYNNADMSKPDEIKILIDETINIHGAIDILVNNAGIQYTATIDEFDGTQWDKIIAINMSSSFHTIKYSLPYMRKNNWGRIINIASVHGLVASINKAAYVAAKHGVVGLTKVVGLETAEENITCNAICPGWVKTDLIEKQIASKAKDMKLSLDEAASNLLSEKQPSKEFATTAMIGGVAVFLCSSAANQITGTTIPVDGGWTAQ